MKAIGSTNIVVTSKATTKIRQKLSEAEFQKALEWTKKNAIEGFDKTVESVKGLKNAAGFLRRELGVRLKLRKTPELRFVADNSIEHSAHIARIIDSFPESTASEENGDE